MIGKVDTRGEGGGGGINSNAKGEQKLCFLVIKLVQSVHVFCAALFYSTTFPVLCISLCVFTFLPALTLR